MGLSRSGRQTTASSRLVGPAIVGGGTAFFPGDARVDLELLGERRFGNGVVHLRHGVRDAVRR